MGLCGCECRCLSRPEEGTGFPQAGATGGCELLDVAGNYTQAGKPRALNPEPSL